MQCTAYRFKKLPNAAQVIISFIATNLAEYNNITTHLIKTRKPELMEPELAVLFQPVD
jgi:hypothetical protein